MIPKIIHYIWLGGKEEPKILEKCKKSWKKHCPDYEIKRWDERELNVNKYNFTRQAYEAKKFAFVSDVFRTEILYNEGGIYLDIDVELLKSIDKLMEDVDLVTGFETSNLINPGLFIAAKKGNKDLQEILNIYKTLSFDVQNMHNITVCEIYTRYFEKQGLISENRTQEIDKSIFYASEYFSPKSLSDGIIRKTKNTHAIHHYAASWVNKSTKLKHKIKQFIKRILGNKLVDKIKDKRG